MRGILWHASRRQQWAVDCEHHFADWIVRRSAPGVLNPLAGINGELVEFRTDIEPGGTKEVVFTVRGATIAHDVERQVRGR